MGGGQLPPQITPMFSGISAMCGIVVPGAHRTVSTLHPFTTSVCTVHSSVNRWVPIYCVHLDLKMKHELVCHLVRWKPEEVVHPGWGGGVVIIYVLIRNCAKSVSKFLPLPHVDFLVTPSPSKINPWCATGQREINWPTFKCNLHGLTENIIF